ncbi:MAG: MarR family transcriptional regulator [Pseudonocardiaceae bacterium]|nr:MarR family transcriptional regulator [Pseudonocardiaceae bacterium]
MTTSDSQHDDDITDRLYFAIVRLNRSLRQTITTGPGQGALSALATLVNCGQMRLGDLAAKESVAAATMSRIVTSLVEMGYVNRDPDPVDRRAWLATATEEGARMVSGIRSTRMHELAKRVDHLKPDHFEALVAALPALEALLTEDS